MSYWAAQLLNGVSFGMLLFFLASGLTLTLGVQRVTVARIVDSRLPYDAQRQRAVITQQEQPCVDSSRHCGRERSGTGDERQTE